MKAEIGRWFRRFDNEASKCEIEEQLQFHLDLLTEEHLQQDLSLPEARAAAVTRFGNVEQIKGECLDITSRSNPLMLAIRVFLAVVFLAGVLMRVNSSQHNITQMANLLIAVPVLWHLLLYVRTLKPSRVVPDPETQSPLMLKDPGQLPFTIYDHKKLTPVERVISDK